MSKLRKTVKALIGWGLNIFHTKPVILFESTPDLADNTYDVYLEMRNRGLDRKYKLVWSCGGNKVPEGVTGFCQNQKLKKAYYMAGAKCMICP